MADTLPCSIQRRHKVNVSPYQQPVVAGSNPATSSKSDRILLNTVTFITF